MICFEQGIRNANLVTRMYQVFDENSDGKLTPFELIKGLSPLLRGTKSEVAGFFFDLYDINGDERLSAAEIIAVYSDMLNASKECDSDGLTAKEKKRIRLWVKDHQQEKAKTPKSVEVTETANEHTDVNIPNNINNIINNNSDDDDDDDNDKRDVVISIGSTLDKETFIKAIEDMDEPSDPSAALLSYRTMYFVFLTGEFIEAHDKVEVVNDFFVLTHIYFAVPQTCPQPGSRWAQVSPCLVSINRVLVCYYVGTFRTYTYELLIVFFCCPAMGALSDRIKQRFDITDEGIGTLTSAYFFAAMVGPLAGGVAMQKWGPNVTIIGANLIVFLGAMCQAIASEPDQLWLLYVGRLLLGFGGEVTPFTTVEILGRLFPDYFGFMAGVRNLVQSLSGFLAFVLLPIWADAVGEGNDGTTFALWMCAILAAVSILTCVITYFSMKKESISTEEQSDQKTITKVIRGFAKATAPEVPGCKRWMLPASFFFAVFGIKAQYFAPFSFTAFSNEIYREKFGRSHKQASFLSGYISLIAGLMSPLMGELSDRIGMRSPCLTIGSFLSVIGFGVLAITSGGGAPVWIASTLFALQYGFGDTVAYISIRFIVGVNRAGIGYGVYGVFGNLLATLAPLVGGYIMEGSEDGIDKVLWYFCGLMFLGTLCWAMVYILEGKRSLLELPAAQVIETSDEDLQLAALTYIVSPCSDDDTTASRQPSEDKEG